jgi:hypothetical protein
MIAATGLVGKIGEIASYLCRIVLVLMKDIPAMTQSGRWPLVSTYIRTDDTSSNPYSKIKSNRHNKSLAESKRLVPLFPNKENCQNLVASKSQLPSVRS